MSIFCAWRVLRGTFILRRRRSLISATRSAGRRYLCSQRMECFVTEFLKITECARSEQMIILQFLTLVSNQFGQIDRLFLAHPEVLTVDGMF